jgi:hypothetical protein
MWIAQPMPQTIPIGPPPTDVVPGSLVAPGVSVVEFGGELANDMDAYRGGQVLRFAVQWLALL